MVAISHTYEAPKLALARLAALGILLYWIFLPLGLALQAMWDLLHHNQKSSAFVPGWDVTFWDFVDLMAAAFLLLLYGWGTITP